MNMTNKKAAETPLNGLVKAMENTPVLVIGDVMLDRFVYGQVERISPESPVPVLAVKSEDKMLGGAGNALANLAGLKVQGHIIGLVGDDEEGRAVKAQVKALGFDANDLVVDAARTTIVKTRFLAGHQQLLRTDYERAQNLSEDLQKSILQKAKTLMPKMKMVILSDYGKGMLTPSLIAALMNLAKDHGVKVIVDPKGQDFSIYRGAYAITPNKKELSEATKNSPVAKDEEVQIAAEKLIAECGIEAVIATRSADGMSVIKVGGEAVHLPGADVEVFDVSGAGDTVIATIAAALAAGSDIVQAAKLANLAGSIVVTKVGTAPIRVRELLEMLESDAADALNAAGQGPKKGGRGEPQGALDWAEAAEGVRRWKARGLKVGFTNGCFDILHLGHVAYLNAARLNCDRLVVGLNRDESVALLKGPERPVQDEYSRAVVLNALASVDAVVLFGAAKKGEDNTAIELLELLKPDLYFKGGDYQPEQIPEAPTVQAYGGQVLVMPEYAGHSTTGAIKKIKSGKAA